MNARNADMNDTGLPIPGREHDPPRSQALEEPAPVVNQTLTAAPNLVERLARRLKECWLADEDGDLEWSALASAAIAELANMAHTDALPTVQTYADELLGECGHHASMPTWDDLDPACKACFLDMANAARNLALTALAAKDATIAEQAREMERLRAVNDELIRLVDNERATMGRRRDMAAKEAADLRSERDAALVEVERLKAEAEAMRKRVRILEIAPKAAWWANDKLGCGVLITDADNAARFIAGAGANATDDWAKAVLEYAAREGGLT